MSVLKLYTMLRKSEIIDSLWFMFILKTLHEIQIHVIQFIRLWRVNSCFKELNTYCMNKLLRYALHDNFIIKMCSVLTALWYDRPELFPLIFCDTALLIFELTGLWQFVYHSEMIWVSKKQQPSVKVTNVCSVLHYWTGNQFF